MSRLCFLSRIWNLGSRIYFLFPLLALDLAVLMLAITIDKISDASAWILAPLIGSINFLSTDKPVQKMISSASSSTIPSFAIHSRRDLALLAAR